MTATINASTSSGVVITPDNSGNILLQYNGVAAPAFSAYVGTNQTLSSGVFTKMQCNTEEFDTASCYDTSLYRFTPTVAGYYQINGEHDNNTGTITRTIISIYKNGSEFKRGTDIGVSSGNLSNGAGATVSALVYLNGSTDYVELYAYYLGGGVIAGGIPNQSYFQGCLLRGA